MRAAVISETEKPNHAVEPKGLQLTLARKTAMTQPQKSSPFASWGLALPFVAVFSPCWPGVVLELAGI